MARNKKQTQVIERKSIPTITQREMAQLIWKQLDFELSIDEIETVIKLEQSCTLEKLKQGYRVVKRDFMCLTGCLKEAKNHVIALDGKTYQIPKRMDVRITLGRGLKKALILGDK